MSFTEIKYAVTDRVAVVTLNRPDQLNAWTVVMGKEVRQAMEQAAADDNVRVIVLTGAGRGFCAGADMKRLAGISASGEIKDEVPPPFDKTSRPDFQRKNTYFPAIPKPIIAAINGPCAGLGMCFALFCDLRFASDRAEGRKRRRDAEALDAVAAAVIIERWLAAPDDALDLSELERSRRPSPPPTTA